MKTVEPKIAFDRLFTDNDHYGDDPLPFMREVALSMSWLYTSEAEGDDDDDYYYENYRLSNWVPLYDLMSIVSVITTNSLGDFGEMNIREYVEKMKYKDDVYDVLGHSNLHYYAKGSIYLARTQTNIVQVVLWVCMVYARLLVVDDNPDDEWRQAAQTFYKVLKDEYPLRNFKQSFLMRRTDKTLKNIANLIAKRPKTEVHAEQPQSDDEATEALRRQVSDLKAKLAKVEAEAAELRRLKAQYEYDVPLEPIDAQQKVRLDLLLRLMLANQADLGKHGNKTKAAQLMQMVTGLPITTCKNYCTNQDLKVTEHQETLIKVNSQLQALGMEVRL